MWSILFGQVNYFWDFARTHLALLLARVLLTFGIGIGTYNVLLPDIVTYIQSFLDALPPNVIAYLGALKFDVCLTIVFSAYAAKLGTKIKPFHLGTGGGGG